MDYASWVNFARIPRHIGINNGVAVIEVPASFIIRGGACTALFVGNIPDDVRWHLLYENDNELHVLR